MIVVMCVCGVCDVLWSFVKCMFVVLCVSVIYMLWILFLVVFVVVVILILLLWVYVGCYFFVLYVFGVCVFMNGFYKFFCGFECGEENGWEFVVEDVMVGEKEIDCFKCVYLFVVYLYGLFVFGCVGNIVLSDAALRRFRARYVRFFINNLFISVFLIIKDVLLLFGFLLCIVKMMWWVLGCGEIGMIVVGGV